MFRLFLLLAFTVSSSSAIWSTAMRPHWIHRLMGNETEKHDDKTRTHRKRRLLLQSLECRRLLVNDLPALVGDVIPGPSMDVVVGDTHLSSTSRSPLADIHSAHVHPDDPQSASEHMAVLSLVDPANVTHHAIASGNWSDPAVWSHSTLPTTGARVLIPENLSVTVDGRIAQTIQTLRIDGTLRFATQVNTELRVDTLVSTPTGNLEMGTPSEPISPEVTAQLVIADTGAIDRRWDPRALSRGAILHGKTVIHGAPKIGWTNLQTAPRAGDTSIALSVPPSGWQVGDSLVIAGTRADATGDEVVRIASIQGSNVEIDRPLEFDHIPPADDLFVHVANTTRNAVIESENAATDRRGHVMFMHNRDVQIANAGFYELGRSDKLQDVDDAQLDSSGQLVPGTGTNPRGRYSVHFHRNGTRKDTLPATVRGSAVVGSPGWGYVNHSSYVDFIDNVSYDVDGAAYNTEVGDEVGSFIDNLSIKTHGTGDDGADKDNQDFGKAGDGFWFHGSGIKVQGNVAAGATGSGIIFWGETLIVGPRDADNQPLPGVSVAEYLVENLPDPSWVSEFESIPTTYVPFRQVNNNQVYGSNKGFEVFYHGDGEITEEQHQRFGIVDSNVDVNPFGLPDSQVDGITVWNSSTGVKFSYTENIQVSNVRIVNDVGQPGEIGFDAGTNLYNGGNHTYRNIQIQGFETGLLAPRGETVVIDGGRFSNGVDIQIPELRQTHRRMQIRGDIKFIPLAPQTPTNTVQNRQNIVMSTDLRTIVDGNVTWFLLSDRVTLHHGAFKGEQLYATAQSADTLLFPNQPANSDPEDPGFPVPAAFIGLTNGELQTRYMSSLGGVIPPEDATDPPDDGIVGLIGSAMSEPALPPKPADIDIAVIPDVPGFEGEDDAETEIDDDPEFEDDELEETDEEEESDTEEESDEEFDEEELEDDEREDDEFFEEEEEEFNEDEEEFEDLEEEDEERGEELDDTEVDEEEEEVFEEDDTLEEDEEDFEFDSEADATFATDVNGDGFTTALDALIVINHLSRHETGWLRDVANVLVNHLDVDGNGSITALDALRIINFLQTESLKHEGALAHSDTHANSSVEKSDDQLLPPSEGMLF